MPTHQPTRRRFEARVGDTRAARDFFAGRYAKVVADTFDHASMAIAEADVPFAVGALTFVGRFDDAVACWEAWRREAEGADARVVAASRFFLGLACARAGSFDAAREWLAKDVRARIRTADPWVASFAFQGLACYRYFTGAYRAAASHARRASRAAHAARLGYTQMLSTDLRGHALVQLGHFHAGTALLEQAKSHAERLGLGMNAFAIGCSIAIYKAKIKIGPDALSDLEELLQHRSHDSYSRRMLLTQAAVQYAIRGRGSEAARALDEADRDALKMDARRAKVTSLIARLHVERFTRGARACAELLDQAAALTAEGDVAFRAELHAFELWVGRALGDAEREARARADLLRLRARSEHHVIGSALTTHDADRPQALAEDELSPLLRAAAAHDPRALGKMLGLGILGPVPELLGLVPGRRIIVLAAENTLLVEDRGDLVARGGPPRWLPRLIRVLGAGGASKERIVAELWGLRRYHPERHDSLVRTTIHRLRTFLEPHGDWVTVTDDGYGLTASVHVFGVAPTAIDDVHLDDLAIDVVPPPARIARAALTDPNGTADRAILAAIARSGQASVPALAQELTLSPSTVLRALRRLVRSKRIKRVGAARSTRYRMR